MKVKLHQDQKKKKKSIKVKFHFKPPKRWNVFRPNPSLQIALWRLSQTRWAQETPTDISAHLENRLLTLQSGREPWQQSRVLGLCLWGLIYHRVFKSVGSQLAFCMGFRNCQVLTFGEGYFSWPNRTYISAIYGVLESCLFKENISLTQDLKALASSYRSISLIHFPGVLSLFNKYLLNNLLWARSRYMEKQTQTYLLQACMKSESSQKLDINQSNQSHKWIHDTNYGPIDSGEKNKIF